MNVHDVRETERSILELLDDGIVRHSYRDNATIDAEEAEAVIALIREMIGEDGRILLLNDMRSKVTFTRGARNYFLENSPTDTVMAFVINSKFGEVALNFFLRFNSPSYTLRVFDDQAPALLWLKQHASEAA